jgi:serine protease Do
MTSRVTRARFSAAVVVAFFCGLIFASGFDLTHFGWAQGRVGSSTGTASKPSASQVAPAVDLESAFEAVADHARPAVVSIDIEKFAKARPAVRQLRPRGQGGQLPPGMEQFFRQFDRDAQPDDTPEEASGSGFIVSEDGYILTNNHVVADADRVNVTLFDKRVFPAKVVGRDSTTDVAVIKIDAGSQLPTISLGDDSKARVGQWVLAIGNPLTLDFTVTAGIVSAKGRKATGLLNPNGQNPYAITDYIQTDAAINPGNSGGPLLNIRGEVIGINSAIASGTGRYEGYGFAIPITLAKQVMDDLVKYGKVRRAVVGVVLGEVSPNDAKAARLTQVGGALVGDFNPAKDSPAEKAGILIGDVIVAADGKPVDQVSTLQRIIRGHKPGDVVDLEVVRYGEKKDFKVKLAEPPTDTKVVADDSENSAPVRPTGSTGRANDRLGITVDAIPQDFLQESKLQQQYRAGLYVSYVSGRGPAFRSLFQSDIILKEMAPSARDIHTAEDLQAAVAPLKSGDVVQFKVCANPDPRTGTCPTRIVSIQIQ